jgi:hypothetical protein
VGISSGLFPPEPPRQNSCRVHLSLSGISETLLSTFARHEWGRSTTYRIAGEPVVLSPAGAPTTLCATQGMPEHPRLRRTKC